MAETTGIEWAQATWNPWYGCKMVSPGCAKCYMFRDMKIYGRDPNVVTRAAKGTFTNPLKWANNGKVKSGSRIFTCSWSDWFIENADEWRPEAWEIIKATPQYTYMILTKRPERIVDHLPPDWGEGYPNVWLGVTVESPKYFQRVITLSDTPAAVRFISYEPALERVDFAPALAAGFVNWLIAGGESDSQPRLADTQWFIEARDDCNKFGVPFFFKQQGGSRKIDGAWGGRVLDGRTWDEFPSV